jgi:hypothetical protein
VTPLAGWNGSTGKFRHQRTNLHIASYYSADKGDTKKKDPEITDQPKSPQKGGQGSSAEDKGTGASGSTGGD